MVAATLQADAIPHPFLRWAAPPSAEWFVQPLFPLVGDNGDSEPRLGATAATPTASELPLPSAPLPTPTAKTGSVSLHSLARPEPAVGFEGR